MSTAPRQIAALVLVCVAALGVRFTGLDHGLPWRTEPDVFVLAQAELARPGFLEGARPDDVELSRAAQDAYPKLFERLLSAWPVPEPLPAGAPRAAALERAGDPFLRGRRIAALAGALVVPATYFLARWFLPAGPALLAAALCATSLLHVNFSQQARPHVLLATFAVLALVAALRARARGGIGAHFAALAATVGALGSLQSGVFCLLPLAASHLLRESAPWRSRVVAAVASTAAAALLALFAFYPQAPSHVPAPLSENPVVEAHLKSFQSFDGSGFGRLFLDVLAYDPVLLVLGLAGALIALARARTSFGTERDFGREALLVTSFALPYLVVFGLYRASVARYAIPLLPVLAVLAATGAHAVAARMRSPASRVVAALALLAFPAWSAYRLVRLRSAPDACARAAAWLERHAAPTDAIWLAPGLELPLERSRTSLAQDADHVLGVLRQPWYSFQAGRARAARAPESGGWSLRTIPALVHQQLDPGFAARMRDDPAKVVAELDAHYVVVDFTSDSGITPMVQRLRAGLLGAGARVVATFAPYVERGGENAGEPRPLRYQDSGASTTSFLRVLLRAEMDGPAIEIYRFD